MFARGAGFWLSGTGSKNNPGAKHLHCVLTAPCANGLQLIAGICSVRKGSFYDPACIISPEDHPDLQWPSFVDYQFARTINQAMIDTHRFGHMLKETDNFTDGVRARIGQGLLESDHATPKLQKYWRDNLHLLDKA